MKTRRWFWCLVYLFVPAVAFTDDLGPSTPLPPASEIVDADNLAEMLVSTPQLVVIDSRIESGRAKGWIEGSIHLPDVETNCPSLQKLVPNRDTPVVFHCTSPRCGRSLDAMNTAKSCGYRHVFWFRGGFEEWKERGYPYITQ